MHRHKTLVWPHLLAAVLTFGLYAVSLTGTYVYDDVPIVQKDVRLRDPHRWGRLWRTDYFNGGLDNLYRPITTTSYAIEWYSHGDRPWAFHLVNCLLAAGVSAAVVELCRRGTGSLAAGAAAGVLFAALPVHVEAIANIVGRAELLMTLGVLGALTLFARRPLSTPRILGIFACYALALLSKEQGLLVPVLLLLWGLLVWPTSGWPVDGDERRKTQWLAIFMIWSTSIYLVVREHFLRFEWDRQFLDWTLQPMVRAHGVDRLLIPVTLLGHYTRLLIWPTVLSPDYGGRVIGWVARAGDPYLRLGIATIITWIFVTALCVVRRRGFLVFNLLAAALVYGMIGNFPVVFAGLMGERLMYLPSVFLVIAVSVLAARALQPRVLWLLVIVAAIPMSVRVVAYAARWSNPVAFWKQAIVDQPMSSQVYRSLGVLYDHSGQWLKAADVYTRESEIYPDHQVVWIYKANADLHLDRLDAADADLRRARAINLTGDIELVQGSIDARRRVLTAATRPVGPRTSP